MKLKNQEAVIYARVSSKKQSTEGSGLASQITRCTEYSGYKNYRISEIFTDDMTGTVAQRPGMKAMLGFIRKRRNETVVVIVDDISRIARSISAHHEIRDAIRKAGGILESPSIEFGEDSDSRLVENLLASVAQHHSQKNSEQVVNRMRARLLNGYAVFPPPPAYTWKKQKGGGNVLVRNEPAASAMAEALDAFAHGRLTTQAEVKRFLEKHPAYPSPTGRLSASSIRDHLANPLYAGYLIYEPWGVSLRKGHHPALVSYETYLKIQDRLSGRSHAPQRANTGEDFALRGFVVCADCEAPLYSSFSRGRSKRYPYYLCGTKGCESYGKSIRRDDLEGEFETLLKSLQPSKILVDLVGSMMKDIFTQKKASEQSLAASIKKDIKRVDDQITGLVDRVVQADSPTLISAYEARITKLESHKAELSEQLDSRTKPKGSVQSKTRTALAFLSSPCNIWKNGRVEDRRAVLRLTFCGQLPYKRGSGFRTVEKEKISLLFRLLGNSRVQKCGMVGPEGLEPPTRPL